MLKIYNWINGREIVSKKLNWLDKYNPHTGKKMSEFVNSDYSNVCKAVSAAENAFDIWKDITPVNRGQILLEIVLNLKKNSSSLARCVAEETGKKINDAKGEVQAAILQGEYFAGEGMRLYGRSLTSGIKGRTSFTVRQPHGVVGLIVPANTPIANIAWKVFPALICGNSIVLKSSEDAPNTANLFAEICNNAGLMKGVLNVIHGDSFAGSQLVQDERVKLISFTGSTKTGIKIASQASQNMKRISLELGGKNPFVVCDDADLNESVNWAVLSAFSNAGQRCASGSRIIVMENIYKSFKKEFLSKTLSLKLGINNDCDLGPLINKHSYDAVIDILSNIKKGDGRILCGGPLTTHKPHRNGYYISPTIIECYNQNSDFNSKELFAPIASLIKVKNISEALEVSNSSEYGLTSSIHTKNIDTAMWFATRVRSGLANINFGTYGSEPHMPFGGFGFSSNGSREPGLEALDVYSELKNISIVTRKALI